MVLGFTTNPLLACGWYRLALTWLLLSWMAVTITSADTVDCNGAVCGTGTVCGPVTCECSSGYSDRTVFPNSPPVVYCLSADTVECNGAVCGAGTVCGTSTCVCGSGYSHLTVIPNSSPPVVYCLNTQPGPSDPTTDGERIGFDRRGVNTERMRITGLAIGFGAISLVLIFVVIGFVVFTHELKKRLAVMAESSSPVASTNNDHQGAANYETIHATGMSRANYEDMSAVQISGQTRMTGSEPADSRNYTNITSADSAYVNVSPD